MTASTFLRGPQQNHEAIVTLQLVEVRPDLDLVVFVAVQICQDGAVVRGGLHVFDQPGSTDDAIKYPVTLNVPGLTGDLKKQTSLAFTSTLKASSVCAREIICLRHVMFEGAF